MEEKLAAETRMETNSQQKKSESRGDEQEAREEKWGRGEKKIFLLSEKRRQTDVDVQQVAMEESSAVP